MLLEIKYVESSETFADITRMKSFIMVGLCLASVCKEVAACCKSKTVSSCCGNGKCNIFCCNCKHGRLENTFQFLLTSAALNWALGCKPNCGMDLQLCWAFSDNQVQCADTVSKRDTILAGNLPALAGSEDEDSIFATANAENIPFCQTSSNGSVRCSNSVGPIDTTRGDI